MNAMERTYTDHYGLGRTITDAGIKRCVCNRPLMSVNVRKCPYFSFCKRGLVNAIHRNAEIDCPQNQKYHKQSDE